MKRSDLPPFADLRTGGNMPPPRTWGLHRYVALAAAFALGAMLAHVGPKALEQTARDAVEYVK